MKKKKDQSRISLFNRLKGGNSKTERLRAFRSVSASSRDKRAILLFKLFLVVFIDCFVLGSVTIKAEAASTLWPQVTWHSWLTRKGVVDEKYDQALSHSLKALSTEPLAPELQINLGNALEALGQFPKAKGAYSAAEKLSDDPQVIFESRFNHAGVLAKDKKIEEALSMYQKALELYPTSKEVKTNIELLMQAQNGQGGENGEEGEKSGEGDDPDKNKDGKKGDGEDPKKFANNPPSDGGKNQGPKEMSASDVKKILEEIKQQEQRIRGDYYRQGKREERLKGQEGRREKDW